MARRIITAAIGGIVLVAAIIALTNSITANNGRNTVDCGNALTGLGDQPALFDKANEINEPILDTAVSKLKPTCEKKINLRRIWAWPLAAIGLLTLTTPLIRRRRTQPNNPPPPT